MVILVTIVLVGMVLGFLEGYGILSSILGSLLGGLIAFAIGIMLLIPMTFWSNCLPTTEKISTEQIYALNDASEVDGRVYLSSGTINEQLVYRYMTKGDLGLYAKEVKASNAYIQEGHKDAYVEHHDVCFKYWWCHIIGVEGLLKDYDVFYVPEGSVTTEYKLNLE